MPGNSRHGERSLFFVIKVRPGRYRACVDLNGRRYTRDAPTRDEANTLLYDLQQRLCVHPGPVKPMLETWIREE